MPAWYTDPYWLVAVLFVVVGFAGLLKGAAWLVEGAVSIAERSGLSHAVIGATVIAFGTSLPELVVTLGAAIKAVASPDGLSADGPIAIAVGNVVGSNIFNVGLILGVAVLIAPLTVSREALVRDLPLMLVAMAVMVLMSLPLAGGPAVITRWEGTILIACLIAYTVFAVRTGKVELEEIAEFTGHRHGLGTAIGLIAVGILGLVLGGALSLQGAVALARQLGVGERVIGLTVMAIGTSLPELVTSIQAARKGHGDLALGNVLGSNLFNVCSIIGITALVLPLPVNTGTLYWDYWWMMGFGLILVPLILIGRRLERWHGALLVVALLSYLVLIIGFQELTGG